MKRLVATILVLCSSEGDILGQESTPANNVARSTPRAEKQLEWRSLFDGKSLERWTVPNRFDFCKHGKVHVTKGRIVLERGQPATAVRYSGRFPKTDYELSLEAMRVEGEDFFCGLTFPVNDKALSLILGGWRGSIVGLSCIDDEPAVENETCVYREFDQQRWYAIRLRVTTRQVKTWIDGKKVIDQDIAGRKLSLWFEEETVLPLSIATWQTTGAVRNIRWRPLNENR